MSDAENPEKRRDSNLSNEALQNRIEELEEENKKLKENCNDQTGTGEENKKLKKTDDGETEKVEQNPTVSVPGTLQFDKDRDYFPLNIDELENNGKRKLKEDVDTTNAENLLKGLDYKKQFRNAYRKYIKQYLTLQLVDGYVPEVKDTTDDFPTDKQIDFLIGVTPAMLGMMMSDITERDPIPLDILSKSNEILMRKEFKKATLDLIKNISNFEAKIPEQEKEKTIVIGVDDSEKKQAVLLLADGSLKFMNNPNTPKLSLSNNERFMIHQISGLTNSTERMTKKPLDLDKVDIKDGENVSKGFILKFTGTKATGGKRKTKKKKSNKKKKKINEKKKIIKVKEALINLNPCRGKF